MRRMPAYYKEFHCICSACTDNCCRGSWEIDIDRRTLERYRLVPGALGERLRNGISSDEPPHFLLRADGSCPFLNADGLCELVLELGADGMCEICAEHPRFYSAHGGLTDLGLGLCCEEAARLALGMEEPLHFVWEEDGVPLSREQDFQLVLRAQETAFALLQERRLPPGERLALLLALGEELQPLIDAARYNPASYGEGLRLCEDYLQGDWPDLYPAQSDPTALAAALLRCHAALEPLHDDWPARLENTALHLPALLERRGEPLSTLGSCGEQAAVYLVHRYLPDALEDGDLLSRCKLPAIACLTLELLALESGDHSLGGHIANAKAYSQEVEYSPANLNALLDATWQEETLSTPALLALLL